MTANLHPIHNEAEYDSTVEEIKRLWGAPTERPKERAFSAPAIASAQRQVNRDG